MQEVAIFFFGELSARFSISMIITMYDVYKLISLKSISY